MKNIDVKPISGHTGLICLLGSPVAHSISPAMHNTAFAALGLDYRYLAFDVDADHLADGVKGLQTLGARGFNLTMPCKNRMWELCDDLSPAASLAGAVNTVVIDPVTRKLTGHITDGAGYMRSNTEAGYSVIGKKMTLLGAGGAATAILIQAALDGVAEISVFSRRSRFWDRAVHLTNRLNGETACKVTLYDYEDPSVLKREIQESALLTNATSVGMAPNTEGCLIPDTSYFHPELVVSDIIYNPAKTRLMALAEKAGCATLNGMYMLLYQGAEAFRLWTGVDMPVELVRESCFHSK